jgi:hypothetical protein
MTAKNRQQQRQQQKQIPCGNDKKKGKSKCQWVFGVGYSTGSRIG